MEISHDTLSSTKVAASSKILEETSGSRSSPTTVVDVEDDDPTNPFPDQDSFTVESSISIGTRHQYNTKTQFRNAGRRANDRCLKPRRKKKEQRRCDDMSILSTIPEATTREEEGGDDDKSRVRVALPLDDDLSVHIRAIPMSPKGNHNHHRITEVQLLIDAASQRASQGNEAKALEIYEDCLGILEVGVQKITEQMEASVSSKPRFQNTALSIILHEEWAEIALVIADVRTSMAILYERNEDYQEAIECCETARSIYERQAIFDEKHCKKGSSARGHEDAMETMMERIDEAKETQDIRRSLHDTVQRIQDKLEATTDQTSRGFLYEDIFDKLSTVLSLELMYLGQTHPQIAITKGLLSTFYMELGQTEKALQAMNEAVWICEMSLGDSHPRTGAAYYEAASLYELTGGAQNAVKAIDLYEKCIATLQKAEGRVSDQLSSAMNRAGALLCTQHDRLDDALRRLQGAILVIQEENQHRERSGDGSAAEPVGVWLNLGKCYRLRNEHSLAATAYRSALRSQRSSREAHEKAFGDGVKNNLPEALRNPAIASTLKFRGMSLARAGRFEKSYDCFLEALALVQSDFDAAQESAKFDTSIDLASHLDRVASVLYELAKAKHQDGKCVEATRLYEESLQLRTDSDRKRGAAVDGKDRQQKQQQQQQQQQPFSTNAKHCAMSLVGIGLIYLLDNNNPTEAFNSFARAVSCLPWDEKHEQIIATLLWDQSRIDSDSCGTKQRGGGRSIKKISESTAQMIRRLEKKAEAFRKSREYNHCLKTMELVIGVKRYHLQLLLDHRATAEADADGQLPSSDGRDQNHKNDDEDEQIQAAKRNLADSLITMGEIVLVFTNAKRKSTDCINEARDLLKCSNGPKDCADTEKLLRQVNQIRRSIRKMKQRSETMAEF